MAQLALKKNLQRWWAQEEESRLCPALPFFLGDLGSVPVTLQTSHGADGLTCPGVLSAPPPFLSIPSSNHVAAQVLYFGAGFILVLVLNEALLLRDLCLQTQQSSEEG